MAPRRKSVKNDILSVIKQTQWMPDSENTTQESLIFFCCLVTWLAYRTWWLSKPHGPTVATCEHSWWLGSRYSQNEQRYRSAHDSTVPDLHLSTLQPMLYFLGNTSPQSKEITEKWWMVNIENLLSSSNQKDLCAWEGVVHTDDAYFKTERKWTCLVLLEMCHLQYFLYVKAWQSEVRSNKLQILYFVQCFAICTSFSFKTG